MGLMLNGFAYVTCIYYLWLHEQTNCMLSILSQRADDVQVTRMQVTRMEGNNSATVIILVLQLS